MSTILDAVQRVINQILKPRVQAGPKPQRRVQRTSKYMPHQGEREKARRRRQMGGE
jgi:hypothetical protein